MRHNRNQNHHKDIVFLRSRKGNKRRAGPRVARHPAISTRNALLDATTDVRDVRVTLGVGGHTGSGSAELGGETA